MEKREPQAIRHAAAPCPAAAVQHGPGNAAAQHAPAADTTPNRPADNRIRMVAGLCLGLGMYGVIHALRTEEGALRLTAAAVTLACGLLPALRIRKRTPRKNR